MVMVAKRGCHLKGMVFMPLKFKAPTVAVKNINKKVTIPPYITSGLPRKSVKARL